MEDLTKERMIAAADEEPALLGRKAKDNAPAQYATEHQALMVCHMDTDNPHVHVVVNRVHPGHGRMLVESCSKQRLSRWALRFEEQNGNILCKKRVENNAARDRGEFVRGEKKLSRHLYELETKNLRTDADRIRQEQRSKDRQLSERIRQVKQSLQSDWDLLHDSYRSTRETLTQRRDLQVSQAAQARTDHRSQWKQLFAKQRSDLVAFGQREKKLFGRIRNAIGSIDWRALIDPKDRVPAVREVFVKIGSPDARLAALQKAHQTEVRRLQTKESAAAREAAQRVQKRAKKELRQRRIQFLNRREALLARQDQTQKAIRTAWHNRTEERTKAWHSRVAQRDFNAAAKGADSRKESERATTSQLDTNPRRRKRREEEYDRGR